VGVLAVVGEGVVVVGVVEVLLVGLVCTVGALVVGTEVVTLDVVDGVVVAAAKNLLVPEEVGAGDGAGEDAWLGGAVTVSEALVVAEVSGGDTTVGSGVVARLADTPVLAVLVDATIVGGTSGIGEGVVLRHPMRWSLTTN
jgi:hypothetical protein